jgi:energy-coupling factor transporter ATP-binding protein EcfA2
MIAESVEKLADIGQPTNPFPGLRLFEFHESHLFFGRDGQSEQLIAKLGNARFLAIVGTSGSGKSSLVRAGLLPALLGGFMATAGSRWRIAIMRPGNDPIGNLARVERARRVRHARPNAGTCTVSHDRSESTEGEPWLDGSRARR